MVPGGYHMAQLTQAEIDSLFQFAVTKVLDDFPRDYSPLYTDFAKIITEHSRMHNEHRVDVSFKKLWWTVYLVPYHDSFGNVISHYWHTEIGLRPEKHQIEEIVASLKTPASAIMPPAVQTKSLWDQYQEAIFAWSVDPVPCYFCSKPTTMGLPSLIPGCAACVIRHVKAVLVAEPVTEGK